MGLDYIRNMAEHKPQYKQHSFMTSLCFSSCFLLAIGCVTSQLPAKASNLPLAAMPGCWIYSSGITHVDLKKSEIRGRKKPVVTFFWTLSLDYTFLIGVQVFGAGNG